MAVAERIVSGSETAPRIINLNEGDFRRGHEKPGGQGASEGGFTLRDASAGKLDAGRTVRSGYAYDFGLDSQMQPEDAERAAAIKALIGDEPLTGIERRYAYRFVKRAFDIAFSAGVLVAFSWLYLGLAVAVKLDDPKGPVLFKQERVGKGGRRFNMFKFRSMCVDAEERLAELQELNEKSGPVFKIADDPRITRVGKMIRKLSLDELPQFFNVLRGDMSVVGPRPALPKEVEVYTPYQRQRLLVRGGLAWDIIAPKLGAGEKVSRARFLSAYEGKRKGRVMAA